MPESRRPSAIDLVRELITWAAILGGTYYTVTKWWIPWLESRTQHQPETKETSITNRELATRLQNIIEEREREARAIEDSGSEAEPDGQNHDRSSPKRRRTGPGSQPLLLSSYEQQIASEIINPSDIPVTFADIGGLDAIIADLQESVIYPLTLPQLYSTSSSLLSAPSGVLLYGPPGCGKTMLAKALAHESGACFINLHISTLTEKWYGDSNKLVAAVFSLARKLAPSIVFIDEIDAVLGSRRSGEHEASGMIKAEMMTHIDGLASANKGTTEPQKILVLGATNRVGDIDEAILRRMPKRFAVGLPDAEQRRRIFELTLRGTRIDEGEDENGNRRHFDLEYLVKVSKGMSGSDIKEACREAAMASMREFIQERRRSGKSIKAARVEELRGLRTEDFFQRPTSNMGTESLKGSMANGRAKEPEDDGYETTDEELSRAASGKSSRRSSRRNTDVAKT